LSAEENEGSPQDDDLQMNNRDDHKTSAALVEPGTAPQVQQILFDNNLAATSAHNKPGMMVLTDALKSVINNLSQPIERMLEAGGHLLHEQITSQSHDTNTVDEGTSEVQYPKLPDMPTIATDKNKKVLDSSSYTAQLPTTSKGDNNEIQSSAVVDESLYPTLPSTSNDFHVQSAESYEEQQTEVDSDYEDVGASVTVSRLVIGGIHAEESMGSTVQLSMRSAGIGLASRQSRDEDSKAIFTKSRLGEEVMTADDKYGEDSGDMNLESGSEEMEEDVEVIDLDEMEFNVDDGEEVDFDDEEIEDDEEDVDSESDSQSGLPTNKNYKLTSSQNLSDQGDSDDDLEGDEQDISSEDDIVDDQEDDSNGQQGSDHNSGEDTESR